LIESGSLARTLRNEGRGHHRNGQGQRGAVEEELTTVCKSAAARLGRWFKLHVQCLIPFAANCLPITRVKVKEFARAGVHGRRGA
jgi:hypothetical protein